MKTLEQIKEGNKLIAEFMGNNGDEYARKNKDAKMFYDSSWSCLIPVIHEIRKLEIITNVNYNILGDFIIEGLTNRQVLNFIFNREDYDSDLSMAYNAVVEFITWYNKHKKE
jgi:hypothetical protein